jgi:hypothetical protein
MLGNQTFNLPGRVFFLRAAHRKASSHKVIRRKYEPSWRRSLSLRYLGMIGSKTYGWWSSVPVSVVRPEYVG